jgi:hypothetical protein
LALSHSSVVHRWISSRGDGIMQSVCPARNFNRA